MKRIFSTILTLVCALTLMAQSPANRTVTTIVADVLAQMPAKNQTEFDKQMNDLSTTGVEGVQMLVGRLNPPGQGSNAIVEYALSGLTAFVSAPGKEQERQAVKEGYLKALANTNVQEVKAFINQQLYFLGEKVEQEQGQPTVRQTTNADYRNQRIPTLAAAFQSAPEKALKTLEKALKDGNKEYRNAALRFASDYANSEMYTKLVKSLPKMKSDVKVDVLNWLGYEALASTQKNNLIKNLQVSLDVPGKQVLLSQLANANPEVKEAAAWALQRIGDTSVISSLASLLRSDNATDVALGQQTLAAFSGNITDAVTRSIAQGSDAGKIAGLQLLAGRKANLGLGTVIQQAKSDNADVRKAAYVALKDVVEAQNFTNMCGMLEEADAAYVPDMQQAVIATIAGMPDAEQVQTITQRMNQSAGKSYLYYAVLATTGDAKALETIKNNLNASNASVRDAAFNALLAWKDRRACEELLNICKSTATNDQFEKALTRYVTLASDATMTGENRLILLREALAVAKTDAQRNSILTQIEKTDTFQALMLAGQYLDNTALQQAAASAVMNIAIAHPEFNGTNVRNLLDKTARVLNNPDADYQRQNIRKFLEDNPAEEGFVSIFNGKDLTGWKGLVQDPIKRSKMTAAQLQREQQKADEVMRQNWTVEDGSIAYVGHGYDNLCTVKQYGDFEMYVDWMLDPAGPEADAGIYLRGAPQVQIWDTARVNVGAQVGSGGLYNNKIHQDKPLKVADNKLGEWNSFYIKMVGDRVTVRLNGELVVDNVIMENYWDRSQPIFPIEQLELQAHGSKCYFRNIYVKELKRQEPFKLSAEEQKEGFKILFDGTNMYEWTGNLVDYKLNDGCIEVSEDTRFGGNLYTVNEYANFIYRFDFQLTPGANNGVGIRTPMEGDAAYVGMEIQILDCEHEIYKDITPLQHHGSVYGIIPAREDHHSAFRPAGEWNSEEILADGDHIRVTVNGQVILDGNIREATVNGTADHKEHPGLFNKKGHIGFLGHGSPLKFRNIRIKELK